VSTIVKAAAMQISPVLYSRHETVERVVKKIRALGKRGVRSACDHVAPLERVAEPLAQACA
jgi:hypothetical protein